MANEFKVRKSLVVNGSGSVLLDVQGSQGQLFSITDSLSGSLFSVKDISGMPIMEVFSDDTVRLGQYAAEAIIVSGSFARMTGSLLGTASYATQALTASNANTASYVLNAVSSSFAATASSADNLTVRGTLTAQTINVQTITSSIEFNTGSTRNGSLSTNTHEFTGSVGITGSLSLTGNATFGGTVYTTQYRSFGDNTLSTSNTASSIFLQIGNTNYFRLLGSNGNITIQNGGTYTDNGYRLQVNGAGSASGSLFVSGSSIFSGSITSTTGFIVGEGTQTPDASGTITIRKGVAFAGLDLMSARTSGNIGGMRFFDSTNAIKSTIVSEVDGSLVFANNNIERLRISPTGSVGIGTTSLTGFSLHVGKNITGGTVTYGIAQTGQIQSDVTNTVYGTLNQLNTQATAFTLSNYYHFTATQGNIGAGSAITSQAGFIVLSNLTGATNNFGFRGLIPSGVGDWNLYMDGTANNYLAGNLGIGSGKTVPTVALDVNGSALITGSLRVTQGITGSLQGTASFATSASFALTASYISGSGGGVGFPFSGSAIITGSLLVSSSFVDFTKATYVTGSFTGSLQGSSSFATTSSYALFAANAPGTTATFTQSVAATTWSFTHNLNTRNPLLQVYDSTNSQVIPFNIVGTDPNQATIYFDTAESGFAVASNGGGLTVSGSTARLDQTSAAVTWSFTHNLATKYPNFEIWDSNDDVVIPAGIHSVNDMTAEIYFAFPTTGVAIASFSGIAGSPNATTASYAVTATTASYANNFIVANTLTIDQTLTDYHVVPSSIAGSNNMFNLVTGSYSSGFFKYTVANGNNARSGEIMAVWAGGSIQFTDNSTLDIGNTSGVTAAAVIVSNSVQFNLTTATSGWRLKSLATFM